VVTENRLAIVIGRWRDCKLVAPLVNPDGQLYEICQRQLLDSLLDFLNLAYGVLAGFQFARQEDQIWKNLVVKDAATPGSGVGPANAPFLFAVRRRLICRFEVVNIRIQDALLAGWQSV
jgi:hypothetical protein